MEAFPTDSGAWLRQHAAIWAPHAWPSDTRLSISSQPGGPNKDERGAFTTRAMVDVTDADAIWAAIEPWAAKGHNT